jgi:hypothetical protein
MGSTTRQQVLRIVLLALVTASVGRAQQAALPVTPDAADPSATATDSAAVPAAPPEAPVMPPKVVCHGDQMTISANNSTLSSVLAEVQRCMGTKIDLPEGAGDKHMFDRIGPGPASEVLDEFLSATGYNYIIGSSPSNQDKIDSIMLLARVTDPASAAANLAAAISDGKGLSTNRRAFLQMRQNAVPHPMTDADTAAAEAAAQATAPAPAPETTPAEPTTTPAPATTETQPTVAPPADATPAPQQTPTTPPANVPTTNPSTGAPATTQDQITNMQQMFELRKQLNQQNQNQTPPPQP